MQLIIPYTQKLEVQEQHLKNDGWSPNYIDVSHSDNAYFELLNKLWAQQEGFILVEHDIIPWPGALSTLEYCTQLWCGFQYFYPPPKGHKIMAHGCTRFSTKLIQKIPNLLSLIEYNDGPYFDPIEQPKHWKTLDGRMNAILKSFGFEPHIHQPPVVHLGLIKIN